MTGDVADKRFGRYRVTGRLGTGAMGAVYRARDDALGRDVAVKTIHGVGRSAFASEVFRARFDREARAVAALSHPNIVPIFDVGVEDDTPFLVMELVEGPSLAQRIEARQLLTPDEACALGYQLAGALHVAHQRGIVHRDVKPGNVLEVEAGVWKLADFGVAHVPESSTLTITGQFLGSPAYAAPESLQCGEFGPASDVYGLGATLYEALAGTPPYGPRGVLTEGVLASGAGPRSIGEVCPIAPGHLVRGIMGALERDPRRRPSAAQLAGVLSAPPPARPGSRRRAAVIALVVATLVVGIAVGAGLSSDSPPGAPSAAPVPAFGAGEPARELSPKDQEKIARDWSKVEDGLSDGKYEKAIKHLDKILRRDPDDARARDLYRQLVGEDWDGGRGRGRGRGHD